MAGKMANINSILAADCGDVTTSVALIEKVEGLYRLVARGEVISTHGSPWNDVTQGVLRATREIELVTNIRLMQDGEIIIPRSVTGVGVDAFVAVSSAGPPLRVVLAGLVEDLSLAGARRVASSTHTIIVDMLSLEQGMERRSDNRRVEIIHRAQPDAVLIVGGVDDGAERPVLDLAQVVALACSAFDGTKRPRVIYAGNTKMRQQVAELVGDKTELAAVDNVRPTLGLENIAAAQSEFEELYRKKRLSNLPGFERLQKWSKTPVMPAAKGFSNTVRYLSARYDINVIGADVGSGTTSIACATTAEEFNVTAYGGVGVGSCAKELLSRVEIADVIRWLPFEAGESDVQNLIFNKSVFPRSLPETREEMLVECALAREVLRLVRAQAVERWQKGGSESVEGFAKGWNLVIGCGSTLTRAPGAGLAALMLLDGLEVAGVYQLAVDSARLISALGAVAGVHPPAAAEVAHHDAFVKLGTVVAPYGVGKLGDTAIKYRVEYDNGEKMEAEVPFGEISVMPLGPGRKATLELRPAYRFDVGLGQPGKGATAEAEGGILGIIIDARGRPIHIPPEPGRRVETMGVWLRSLVGWEKGYGLSILHQNE